MHILMVPFEQTTVHTWMRAFQQYHAIHIQMSSFEEVAHMKQCHLRNFWGRHIAFVMSIHPFQNLYDQLQHFRWKLPQNFACLLNTIWKFVRHNSVLWNCVRLCYICNEKPYTDRRKSSLCFIPSSDFILGDNCKGGHYFMVDTI